MNPMTDQLYRHYILFPLGQLQSFLPLVMQSLAPCPHRLAFYCRSLCFDCQAFMSFFAKICGDSPIWGRKGLMIVVYLCHRCFYRWRPLAQKTGNGTRCLWLQGIDSIDAILDSVGAGIIGTLQILVTVLRNRSFRCWCHDSRPCAWAPPLLLDIPGHMQDHGYPTAFYWRRLQRHRTTFLSR
jgi:hypothetical protein